MESNNPQTSEQIVDTLAEAYHASMSDSVEVVERPRIGRPKGSKNKPKRGRPKGSKTKRRATPKPTSPIMPPKPLKGWERYLVRVNDKIDENKPLLMIGDRLLVSAGGIATIAGKPKSYKTFLSSAILGAYLMGEYMNITSCNKDNSAKALLCDTEQGRARTQMVIRRVQRMCQMNTQTLNRRLQTISVREISSNERSKVLADAIYDIKPKLVVLDGIRDLVNDFNNIQESIEVVDRIMRAASEIDCAIVVIIHLNKGDDNIRGHLGSELCNKSETVVKLKSECNGTVRVSPLHCRDIEFEEFAFRVAEDGLPTLCSVPPHSRESAEEMKQRQLLELFEGVFGDTIAMSRRELIDGIVNIEKQSAKTAERRIASGVSGDIIQQLQDGTYKLITE